MGDIGEPLASWSRPKLTLRFLVARGLLWPEYVSMRVREPELDDADDLMRAAIDRERSVWFGDWVVMPAAGVEEIDEVVRLAGGRLEVRRMPTLEEVERRLVRGA